jgi:CubicO group peptidase (beta-lactamase class C family)
MENVIMNNVTNNVTNKLKKTFVIILVLLFSFISTTCLTEEPLKMPFTTYTPPNLGDGWDIAEPGAVDIDGEALKDVYGYVHDDDNIWQIRSLLVFKNGKLVAESYMKDNGDRTEPRHFWSCTKQVIGILTGVAIDKGYISSVNDAVSDYLPQVSQYPEKSSITIENLLMMKSGINYSNDGPKGQTMTLLREIPSNSLDYILGLGMNAVPGTEFLYKDGDPHIMSAVIQQATGKTTRDWAKEVLFDEIGITGLQWVTYKDGITHGGYGILTTPREFAKIGQLVLNRGVWDGKTIVSGAWIEEMTSSKVPAGETQVTDITFGYFWWKDITRNVEIMWGHGGQYVFINRNKNLIVAMTCEPDTTGKFVVSVHEGLSVYDRIDAATK